MTVSQSSKLPGEVRRASPKESGLAEHLMHNASLECGGFARDPAKVEDQVRFLAGTFFISITRHRCSMAGRLPPKQPFMTTSTGASTVVRTNEAGCSVPRVNGNEFDSHRCLFNACLDAVIAGGAFGSRVSLTYSVNGF
jgi:hypothetical protein